MNTNKELETIIYNEIKNNFKNEFLDGNDNFEVRVQGKEIVINNLVDTTDTCGDEYDEDSEDFESEYDYIQNEEQNQYEFERNLEQFVKGVLKKHGYETEYQINRIY